MWIPWPGTSEPQEYKAVEDTGVLCALMPLGFKEAEPVCISGMTGGSQQLTTGGQSEPNWEGVPKSTPL